MSSSYVLELVLCYLFKGNCARIFQALTDTTLCKNIHRSITKKDSTDVSATPVSRKVLSCIFIDTQEADDHSLYNHCQYCFSTSPRLFSMPFSKLLFKNLHPPFSENFLFGIANRNAASLRQ